MICTYCFGLQDTHGLLPAWPLFGVLDSVLLLAALGVGLYASVLGDRALSTATTRTALSQLLIPLYESGYPTARGLLVDRRIPFSTGCKSHSVLARHSYPGGTESSSCDSSLNRSISESVRRCNVSS